MEWAREYYYEMAEELNRDQDRFKRLYLNTATELEKVQSELWAVQVKLRDLKKSLQGAETSGLHGAFECWLGLTGLISLGVEGCSAGFFLRSVLGRSTPGDARCTFSKHLLCC